MTAQEKIDKILEITQLEINEFAMECKIIPNSLKAAIKRDALTNDIVTKIHDRFGVRKGFFSDEKEPIFEDNLTLVQKEAAVAGKLSSNSADIYKELYEKFMGTGSEYLLIHRDVLKEHRLVAVEQFEKDKKQMADNAKELDDRTRQIERLFDIIRDVSTRPINIQIPNIEKT